MIRPSPATSLSAGLTLLALSSFVPTRALAAGATESNRNALSAGERIGDAAGMDSQDLQPGISAEGAPPVLSFPNHPGWPASVLGGASPPVCADIDPAVPGLETLVGTLASSTNLYAWHQDGTPVPGYPLSLGFWIAASPSIGDIDGDGQPEIVVGIFGSNQVAALELNGAPLPGWPIAVGANVRSTAALADLDPSVPGLEVIVGVQDGTVQAWHGDGTNVPGWPVQAGNFVERCSPAVGDVDGDGDLEVFVGSWYDYNPGSTGGVYGFDHTGAPLPGWPQLTATHTSVIASPVLADLDGDGRKEIITGTYETNGRIFVWRLDGTLYPGWPFTIPRGPSSGSLVSSSPAVGDIDGDGQLEIVDGSCGQCGTVYAWNRDGTVVPGWPALTNAVVDGSSPCLGDVDGDGGIEIMIGSGSGFTPYGCQAGAISRAYLLRADGTNYPGWPLDLGTAAPPNPALADLDLDGKVEIVLSFSQAVYVWDAPGAFNAALTPWPYFHLGIDHTGDFVGADPAGLQSNLPGSERASEAITASPSPWPGTGAVSLRVRGSRPAGRLWICDSAGRLLRAVDADSWDGRDASGEKVPAGVYFIREQAAGGSSGGGTRIVVVR